MLKAACGDADSVTWERHGDGGSRGTQGLGARGGLEQRKRPQRRQHGTEARPRVCPPSASSPPWCLWWASWGALLLAPPARPYPRVPDTQFNARGLLT